jgi:hypothetical protein
MDRVGELEIEQDLAFQERSWRLQKIAGGLLAALLLGGLRRLYVIVPRG